MVKGKSGGVLAAAAGVASLTLIGNGLGFLRDIVLAAVYGASAQSDAFVVAWTVPETISPLLMDGVIPLVLVPWLVRRRKLDGSLAPAASKILAPVTLMGAILAGIVVAGAPVIVHLVAPELSDPGFAATCVMLAAGSAPAMMISGTLSAVLRTGGALIYPALVYSAYNIGILATILALNHTIGVKAAALGLTIGAALMVLIQLPPVFRMVGVPRPTAFAPSTLTTAMAAAIPTLLYLAARQGQVLVERHFGATLSGGSITALNLAQKLGQVPVTVILSLALVSFPAIANLTATGQRRGARGLATGVFITVVALVVPASLGIIMTSDPLVQLAFGRGKFTQEDVARTASTLSVYTVGLLSQGTVTVMATLLYAARRRTYAPAVWLLVCLGVTYAVAAHETPRLGTQGIALANVAGITSAAVGLVIYASFKGFLMLTDVFGPALRTGVAGGLSYGSYTLLSRVTGDLPPIVQLGAGAACIIVCYLVVNLATRNQLLRDLSAARSTPPPTTSQSPAGRQA